ncbi:TRAP-type mannitol/chloroaromatic compound transport system, small permease component [Cognatishimia activa]|uniref:TRAP transporter small permease protein n=1 Tax=Cognatishimia activa TaxID=1715691 RepID=A0A0P1IUX6_9RHOB|nr:TRAP transporter small permease subunit [Cognatishimia activa]CUK27468.1 TRAP-type mannitol/chloroaromatic compound transport system, small permease component [Cognatishimia activa]
MPGNADITIEQSIAISDPGEMDRDQQTKADRFVIAISNITAWLFPVLMVAICAQVILRKMGYNQAWLDDAQWWMYGFSMTVGFAYAITTQSHVRVDILHQNFSPEKKARVEVFGLGWLLLPFLAMMTDILFHYGWTSLMAGEGSDSPNGLHRLYLLKMSLPLIFALACLATISMLVRHLRKLRPATLAAVLIAAFPGAWFIVERIVFYILWWSIRLTDSEIQSRRIIKEPLLEPTIWYGLAILVSIITISTLLTRRQKG